MNRNTTSIYRSPALPEDNDATMVDHALCVIGGKWTVRILMNIVNGFYRYREFIEQNPGLTDKILSHNLRLLTDECLVRRVERKYPDKTRMQVEYRLTQHGETLKPVVEALARWGDEHHRFIERKKMVFV